MLQLPIRRVIELCDRRSIVRKSALEHEFFRRNLQDVLYLSEKDIRKETRLVENFGHTGVMRLSAFLEELRQEITCPAKQIDQGKPERLANFDRELADPEASPVSGDVGPEERKDNGRMFYGDFSSAVLVDMLDLTRFCRAQTLDIDPAKLAETLVRGAPLVSFQCHPSLETDDVESGVSGAETLVPDGWGEKGLAGLSLALSAIRLSRVVERIFIVTSDPAFIPVIRTVRGLGAKVFVVFCGDAERNLPAKATSWGADAVVDIMTVDMNSQQLRPMKDRAHGDSLVNA